MSNLIWGIGLFTKVDKFTEECIEFKTNNRPNCIELLVKLLTPIEELSLIFLKSTLSTQLPYAKILVSKLKNLDLTVENSDRIKIAIPEIGID